MCALLFCARILVTHRSKEKYLIAELKESRVKYLVLGAWNINNIKKKNKQTDMTTKILPDSIYRARKLLWIECKRGRWFKRKFTIVNFGHSMNNTKEYGWNSLFVVLLPIQLVKNLSYWIKRTKGIIQYAIKTSF